MVLRGTVQIHPWCRSGPSAESPDCERDLLILKPWFEGRDLLGQSLAMEAAGATLLPPPSALLKPEGSVCCCFFLLAVPSLSPLHALPPAAVHSTTLSQMGASACGRHTCLYGW